METKTKYNHCSSCKKKNTHGENMQNNQKGKKNQRRLETETFRRFDCLTCWILVLTGGWRLEPDGGSLGLIWPRTGPEPDPEPDQNLIQTLMLWTLMLTRLHPTVCSGLNDSESFQLSHSLPGQGAVPSHPKHFHFFFRCREEQRSNGWSAQWRSASRLLGGLDTEQQSSSGSS